VDVEISVLNFRFSHLVGLLVGDGDLNEVLLHHVLVSLAVEVSIDSIIFQELVVKVLFGDVAYLLLVVLVNCN
jgi:hypothetical protein